MILDKQILDRLGELNLLLAELNSQNNDSLGYKFEYAFFEANIATQRNPLPSIQRDRIKHIAVYYNNELIKVKNFSYNVNGDYTKEVTDTVLPDVNL